MNKVFRFFLLSPRWKGWYKYFTKFKSRCVCLLLTMFVVWALSLFVYNSQGGTMTCGKKKQLRWVFCMRWIYVQRMLQNLRNITISHVLTGNNASIRIRLLAWPLLHSKCSNIQNNITSITSTKEKAAYLIKRLYTNSWNPRALTYRDSGRKYGEPPQEMGVWHLAGFL